MPQPSALIDFVATGAADPGLRLAFDSPAEILVAHTPGEVAGVLDRARAYAVGGRWCVGYVRYEAAQAFDAALRVHAPDGPLAWFAVFESAAPWPDSGPAGHRLGAGHLTLARSDFDRAMSRLHAAIADGETYQVNLTAPWQGDFSGCPRSLFEALHRAQPACYAAFLDTGEEQVLSVSPELFFDWRGDTVTCRPMKGTAARGENAAADAAQAERLRLDAKERAENLMIVDLIRNDLSRVALPFSVRVPSLFDVRAWPTVWQMTSDIEARVPPGLALSQLFAALFPCGSVTGAPKVRAMHWIHELETGPRGVYCGAIGVLQPGGATTFNVAIRTLVLRRGQAVCGLGSGITADARADGEWREWHRKQRFIERARLPFDLLETLRLEAGRFTDDELHLARMAAAATHFGFPWNLERARQALAALARAHPAGAWRARLRATSSGRFEATAHVLEPSGPQRGVVSPHATLPPEGAPPRLGAARRRVVSPHAALPPEGAPPRLGAARRRVVLAAAPIDGDSDFVRFKTTRRGHYEALACKDDDVFDTLLWNERGELTEFTRGNVAVRLDGRWLTPPLSCGLLDGVGRARALRAGRLAEAVIRCEDLRRAQGLAFINSLRGWLEVELVPAADGSGLARG